MAIRRPWSTFPGAEVLMRLAGRSQGSGGGRAHVDALEPRRLLASLVSLNAAAAGVSADSLVRQMEYLDRGVVALHRDDGSTYVGWRLLGTDPADIAFNVYRFTDNGPWALRNPHPISATTDFVDTGVDLRKSNRYEVRAIVGGSELPADGAHVIGANVGVESYLTLPLQIPAGGVHRDGVAYTYAAFEASPGDLDGDGQYEIVLNWQTVNAAESPFFAPQIVDAYKLDGTLLWRIDLGPNLFTEVGGFLVYDLDGDGRAELISRTADGTRDAAGTVIGDPDADWVNDANTYPAGWVVRGPEYLTVFSGLTGNAVSTIPFEPARGNLTDWGDNYGQRSRQFHATIAYLDGQKPSVVWGRGIYLARAPYAAQTQMVAYDFVDGTLQKRWHFKAGIGIHNNQNAEYVGQGNHQMSVADVDGDGRDEMVWGAMVVDDNGQGLFSTGLEHGDALHVGDFNPARPGLEVFGIHENEGTFNPNRPPGVAMYDARTGEIIFGIGNGIDVGRGNIADLDPTHPGAENWGGPGGLRDVNGATISDVVPTSNNFLIWWDGDDLRELLDRNFINKWNWVNRTSDRLLTAEGIATNQGTKQFPTLTADLIGDWREEVVWRAADNTHLRIYTTTIPAQRRIHTLMHDAQYRQAIAWQNFGYNQPPHPSFFIGQGMSEVPRPLITTPRATVTRLSEPDGLTVTPVGPGELQLAWKPVPGASSYRIKRAADAGGPFVSVAANLTQPAWRDVNAAEGRRWHYEVVAVASDVEGAAASTSVLPQAIPGAWSSTLIGSAAFDGMVSFDDHYTLRAAGATSGESMQMLHQTLAGDGEIVARIDGKSNRAGYAGVAIRKSLASNAAYASVEVTPADRDRIVFRWRSADGGSSSYAVAYDVTPVWVKVVRTGNVLTGFYSKDGSAWTQIGTNRTITMPASVPAGVVVAGAGRTATEARVSEVQLRAASNQAPRVHAVDLLDEIAPIRLTIQFSESVLVTTSNVLLSRLGVGQVIPISLVYQPTPWRAIATLSALAPGDYRLTVTGVRDGQNLAMAQPHHVDVRVNPADLDGDGVTGFADLLRLSQNFGRVGMTHSQGNVDRDEAGAVGFSDLLLLAQSYAATPSLSAAPGRGRMLDILESDPVEEHPQ